MIVAMHYPCQSTGQDRRQRATRAILTSRLPCSWADSGGSVAHSLVYDLRRHGDPLSCGGLAVSDVVKTIAGRLAWRGSLKNRVRASVPKLGAASTNI